MNDSIGKHKEIQATYATETQGSNILSETFTWNSVFEKKNGNLPDGGWLVMSDGPNPKTHAKEFAIFYIDAVKNKLTAYAYNGENNSKSFKNNPFLGSWDNILNVVDDGNKRSIGFSVDVAGINSRTDIGSDWKGVKFDSNVGIWFHAAKNVNATYNANGSLKSFSSTAGWFDSYGDQPLAASTTTVTKEVPEPITGTIAAISALGMGSTLKKRSRKQK
ncbi:MAG: hypothetical protein D6728_19160 [Cyanobacteria bacterium J055]|nr:MAG: hypothetical protein D6728_19160 [Cyanobacteria bacterium J055]